MATLGYTVDNLIGGVKVVTWGPLTSTDLDGSPFVCPQWADKCIQVYGTPNGGTVTIQGSNDASGSVTYATIHDPQGNDLAFTAAGIEQVLENTYLVRPLLSGAGGSTSLTVKMLVSTPTTFDLHVANS